jgi:hydroxymethylbilane synthase
MLEFLDKLNHEDTRMAVEGERSFLAALDGSCRTPIAAHAHCVDGKMQFRGLIASLDGKQVLETTREGAWDAKSILEAGLDAGAELKGKAPADFFANLLENGGGW